MVTASAIPNRVPLGFVCGYPVGVGGELYGGSMFIRSAASDTLQGKAIQAANEKWNNTTANNFCRQQWDGRQTIGIPVCKKKYAPFHFSIRKDEETGEKVVTVERMFGCRLHSNIRKSVIEMHGERSGWEPFGQWSMRKVQELARQETERLNKATTSEVTTDEESSSTSSSSSSSSSSLPSDNDEETIRNAISICNNGKCTWKYRSKYDNVYREIKGSSDSDDDDVYDWT